MNLTKIKTLLRQNAWGFLVITGIVIAEVIPSAVEESWVTGPLGTFQNDAAVNTSPAMMDLANITPPATKTDVHFGNGYIKEYANNKTATPSAPWAQTSKPVQEPEDQCNDCPNEREQ